MNRRIASPLAKGRTGEAGEDIPLYLYSQEQGLSSERCIWIVIRRKQKDAKTIRTEERTAGALLGWPRVKQ